jgi:hypothetical protein
MDQTRAEVLSRLKNVRNLPLAVRHAI